MKEFYYANKQFREYVDRYALCNHISIDIALTHKLVKEYAEHITSQNEQSL